MPKIDVANLPGDRSTNYPDPYAELVAGRSRKRLGNAGGLTQFGVNLTTLEPGAWSALRHCHREEDEFVYILEGELVLCEDDGETALKAGDSVAWKADSGVGHCLINRSSRNAVYIEIGTRSPTEWVDYPDVDLRVVRDDSGMRYTHKNGEPYPPRKKA